MIDLSELRQLTPVADAWCDPLNDAMGTYKITSLPRVSFFLATCLYESGGLLTLEENLNYSADGILRMWPKRFSWDDAHAYAHHPELIANRAYAGRNGNGDEASGDGWRYRGQGPIQATGRYNFQTAEEQTGFGFIFNPELARQPAGGSTIAAWFWSLSGCNTVADELDFPGTQGIVNRGSRDKVADNMEGRSAWLRKVKSVLA